MPRILLVKTSSLGDVVHNLPVVSDIHAHVADATVDWVVEEAFADIPRLHPGVTGVLPVALRRWRKALAARATWREIASFRRELRVHEYDAVIDTQGLLKSALIARDARSVRGHCAGLNWPSSREPLRCFYDQVFDIPWGQHAVMRNRTLAARAMGYAATTAPDYGIGATRRADEARYAVLLHATSAKAKLWPEMHWESACKSLFLNNISVILPWGDEAERERSERLCQRIPDARVPPRMNIAELAPVLAGAVLVIGVDTGLTHLAAALGVPTVGIYCDTDPGATGVFGARRAVNVGGIGTPPSVDAVVTAAKALM